MSDRILIVDFGGQYNQLIARRVRECGVYSEIHNFDEVDAAYAREFSPKGIIFTGGPQSAYGEGAPSIDDGIFSLGIPILGICYGAQLMAYRLGGNIDSAPTSEYGRTEVIIDDKGGILASADDVNTCWMSHTDYISCPPEGFVITAHTGDCPVAGMEDRARGFYAVQFHPEVNHTVHGAEFIRAFVLDVCGCNQDWQMDSFAETQIKAVREKVGDGKVLLGLSGGVDSSVVAALLAKAVGPQLTCVFVDHGLLRKNEAEEVSEVFGSGKLFDLNFIKVDAADRFYAKLAGVTEPESKRKIIGEEFIKIFGEEADKLEGISFLAQGTIYPDIIESKGVKAHHNVGGLPAWMTMELVEPVKLLYKDEVRVVGEALGLPHHMVYRQPFPGPGLGVRCLGAITRDRLNALREADAILREEFDKNNLNHVWQYFVAVPDFKSVGVRDGKRYEGWPAIIRAVNTVDAMTATIEEIPYAVLNHITDRITHEVEGINRVCLDLTPKPIGTIEWE